MYGAILGDIIGSPYEFGPGAKTKEFDLFRYNYFFTDDIVMTMAVADALMDAGKDADTDTIQKKVVASMRKWRCRYLDAGYGSKSRICRRTSQPASYNSCGNCSAMRVSSAGWFYDSLDRTREVARATAVVTHNHPDGIKSAESVAAIIWLARNGRSKAEIRDYVIREFGYDLSRTIDEIRPGYHHAKSCQKTVPGAITAFLEGSNFEDVVRTAVSLGGDCDTLTNIAAAMAEAFYGIPDDLRAEVRKQLILDLIRTNNFLMPLWAGRKMVTRVMIILLDRYDRFLVKTDGKTD